MTRLAETLSLETSPGLTTSTLRLSLLEVEARPTRWSEAEWMVMCLLLPTQNTSFSASACLLAEP
jgi:hypothetical protein